MKRVCDINLLKWRNSSDRKPMIVRGARQVGKTFSITNFGNSHFKFFVKIDFEKEIGIKKIFDGDLSPDTIIELLELEKSIKINIGETLLFLDEVQLCPRAIMALRYFFEELPELHVIAAGSLLEFELEKISFPVGRVEFMYMYPLSFDEFLIATGHERLVGKRPTLANKTPLPIALHDKFIKLLKIYFIVGAMPEAVKSYIDGSLNSVTKVHENLVLSFVNDTLKYEKNLEIDILREVFEKIPSMIGREIKYSNISRDITIYKIKQVLDVLKKSLLIHQVSSSSASGLPLVAGMDAKVFKYCFLDIGLMQFMSGLSPNEIIQSDDLLACYAGALCEQYIGQELIQTGGSQNRHLFYWSRSKRGSTAEIDYLLVRNGDITPLEVKNGPTGKLRSLHLFMKEHPHVNKGIVLNTGEIGRFDNIHFLPLYSRLCFDSDVIIS